MFNKNIFGNGETLNKVKDADIIFVSDLFAEDYLGGAELTTEAFVDFNDSYKVAKIKSHQVNSDLIQHGLMKKWIFFNYSGMDLNLIPMIVANLNYSIVEYDYKFCKYRSVEKHKEIEGVECNCHEEMHGKIISAFLYGAESLFWMSKKQLEVYTNLFPFLSSNRNTILSSCFKKDTLSSIKKMRKKYAKSKNNKWIVIGSESWIKGAKQSEKYCKDNNLEYEVVWGLSHNQMLEKLAQSKGHVYLPVGGDTCPRAVIEAKLLGCELVLNKNVQHSEEEWFNGDVKEVEKYLSERAKVFWDVIESNMNKTHTISGYTTTRNCISQKYPFVQSIKSMLGFCDQVVVVDGGSTDGTWETLINLAKTDNRIIIEKKERDWSHPRFAVFDGLQKAYARSLCTGNWCWQMDSDEIVHEKDYQKIKDLLKQVPKSMHLLALPVIEYWGSAEKVRLDVNPWKWRLSRNLKHITHGIPSKLRKEDEDGNTFALPGTDGCDYIDNGTGDVIPCMNFYDENINKIRVGALNGNKNCLEWYENWFNNLVENLPGVHHYSWMDLERKIKTYKNYWSQHWQSLYNIEQEDTIENNMFFDKKWADVSDEEIKVLAKKLKDQMGGWIFHQKVDFDKPTPHVLIERDQPEVMKNEKY